MDAATTQLQATAEVGEALENSEHNIINAMAKQEKRIVEALKPAIANDVSMGKLQYELNFDGRFKPAQCHHCILNAANIPIPRKVDSVAKFSVVKPDLTLEIMSNTGIGKKISVEMLAAWIEAIERGIPMAEWPLLPEDAVLPQPKARAKRKAKAKAKAKVSNDVD